jgi:hypothetical protein
VVSAQQLRYKAAFKVAKHMGQSILISNASFAVVSHSGFVGAILIFVRVVTLDSARETM